MNQDEINKMFAKARMISRIHYAPIIPSNVDDQILTVWCPCHGYHRIRGKVTAA